MRLDMAKSSTSGQGRPKGVPNKLTRTVRDAFEHAFELLQEDNGDADSVPPRPAANLSAWAQRNPTEFYKLASKLIPTEINGDVKGTLIVVTGVPGDEPDDCSDLV